MIVVSAALAVSVEEYSGLVDAVDDAVGRDVFVVSVSDWLLTPIAEARGLSGPDGLLPDRDLLTMRPGSQVRLRRITEALLVSGVEKPGLLSEWGYREALEVALVEALLSVVDESRPMEGEVRMTRARRLALDRAVDLMRTNVAEQISISQIEQECGVSPRTLRYAFDQTFGISPKQFLSILRMNRVRSELKRGECPSVAVAAKRCGFWHMGQFARDYQSLFGQKPSEVLRGR